MEKIGSTHDDLDTIRKRIAKVTDHVVFDDFYEMRIDDGSLRGDQSAVGESEVVQDSHACLEVINGNLFDFGRCA